MDVEEKVEKLKKETIALRKEVIIMKSIIKQQNEIIQELLEKAHGVQGSTRPVTTKKAWFPIQTQEELDEFEKSVNSFNREEIIYKAQLCIRHEGLVQNLNKIMDEKLISTYNLEGNYNKRRFLDYQNLLDVLFKATLKDGWDHSKFIDELRIAMRRIKKRQLKMNSRRNRANWNGFKTNEEDDDDDDGDDEGNDDGNDEDD